MKHGTVVRGWLGVQIQSVTQDIADSLGLKDAAGALVGEVQDGSPAAKAGFKVGDVILAVNGEPVKDSRDLALRISRMDPGADRQDHLLARRREPRRRRDPRHAAEHGPDGHGRHRRQRHWQSRQAVGADRLRPDACRPTRTTRVASSSPMSTRTAQAAERGLQAGDVILSVGDTVGNHAGRRRENDGRRQGRWPEGGAASDQVRRPDAVRGAVLRQDLTHARGGSARSSPRDFRFARTAGRPPGLPFYFEDPRGGIS